MPEETEIVEAPVETPTEVPENPVVQSEGFGTYHV